MLSSAFRTSTYIIFTLMRGPRTLVLEQRLHKTHIFIQAIRHFLGYLRNILRVTPFLQKSKIKQKVQNSYQHYQLTVMKHTYQLRGMASTLRMRTTVSMAATAQVIWLCACVRYWPYRGVGRCASLLSVGIITSISLLCQALRQLRRCGNKTIFLYGRSLLRSREIVLLHDCSTYLGAWDRLNSTALASLSSKHIQ